MSRKLPIPRYLPDIPCGKIKRYPVINHNRSVCTFRWVVLLIFLVIFTLLFPAVVYADPAMARFEMVSPVDEAIVWGPFTTDTTHNSTVIHWKTAVPSVGIVAFTLSGIPSPGVPDQSVSEKNQSLLHQVQLDNLETGQRYSYCIGNNSGYSFRTLPNEGPFQFIVYGDTREQLPGWNQSTHHALVAARIAMEPDCLFVVHTGDLVNDPADEDEWGRFFKAAGPMLANTTFYPVPGNHEGNLSKYEEYFGVPPWYNFTCAGYEFIFLDSNTLKPVMEDEQNRWINQTLSGPSNGRVVFLHHPMYTSEANHWGGFLDVRRKWENCFIGHDVLGVFSAHVHAYEHFYVNGIHYFTVATGGAPSYALSPDKPDGYVYSRENTLGYMRVTVNPPHIMLEFVPVAEVKDGKIMSFPEGIVGEKVVIKKFFSKQEYTSLPFFNKPTPFFGQPVQIFSRK